MLDDLAEAFQPGVGNVSADGFGKAAHQHQKKE